MPLMDGLLYAGVILSIVLWITARARKETPGETLKLLGEFLMGGKEDDD